MRIVTFIMAFLVFLQSLGMEQELLRMNDFIAHAKYHKEKLGDSFWDFLEKHYADDQSAHENQHQSEKDAHHNLPFHGENTQTQTLVCQFVNPVISYEIKPEFSEMVRKSSFFYLNQYDLLKEAIIFKPPCWTV